MDIKLIPSLAYANMDNPGKVQSYGELKNDLRK